MGLWSKGLERAQTGEIRMEESVSSLLKSLNDFLNRFYKQQHTNTCAEISDNILYVRIGQYGGRVRIKTRSHLGMMMTLLEVVNNILINTRDVGSFFFLRDKIIRNLEIYNNTKKLSDLYFV